MTGSELKAWRLRMKLKVGEAAERLGVSPDTYGRWERKADVGRLVALACAAISYGLPPARG